mmetsp:Transcript_20490/g.34960  ORF Transcript_20490/g.34960 Transcript_20490/m.34960 type:complete len:228 (-) Transcript_20490:65-748(-)
MGIRPKAVNETNMATLSLSASWTSSPSGTCSASSSVIMMLRKKVLYFAILVITTSASSRDMPRFWKRHIISSISPSGKFSSSHASRSNSLFTYLEYPREERNSPTDMLSASASTLDMPSASTAVGPRWAPTHPATIANEVSTPSRPPKTIDLIRPPDSMCASCAFACASPGRSECAARLASTSFVWYASRADDRSRLISGSPSEAIVDERAVGLVLSPSERPWLRRG